MAPSLRILSARAETYGRNSALNKEMVMALCDLSWFFVNAPPRALNFANEARPVLVLTDGAVENKKAGSGAVLFAGSFLETFSFTGPAFLMDEWEALGSSHCVAHAEMLSVLAAKIVWRNVLTNLKVLHFIDNVSFKDAVTKGNTVALASLEFCLQLLKQK